MKKEHNTGEKHKTNYFSFTVYPRCCCDEKHRKIKFFCQTQMETYKKSAVKIKIKTF